MDPKIFTPIFLGPNKFQPNVLNRGKLYFERPWGAGWWQKWGHRTPSADRGPKRQNDKPRPMVAIFDPDFVPHKRNSFIGGRGEAGIENHRAGFTRLPCSPFGLVKPWVSPCDFNIPVIRRPSSRHPSSINRHNS